MYQTHLVMLVEQTPLESMILHKLENYTKPIKTKHLAERFGVDRNAVTEILNRLQSQDLVKWHYPKRTDEDQAIGWISTKNSL